MMSYKCPHENFIINESNQWCEPPCGCRFVVGTPPPDPHPTPWEVRSLMIVDAKGDTVLHMGGQQSYIGNRDPKDLVALNQRIVRAVNGLSKSNIVHLKNAIFELREAKSIVSANLLQNIVDDFGGKEHE